MIHERIGEYGTYYGSYFDESDYMTDSQMKTNAEYVFKYLSNEGWTTEAISGLLGNMEAESNINPGCWQSMLIGNMDGGYGLVQWTPASKYINWCSGDASEMDNNLARICYEVENGLQWIPTNTYDFSFKDYVKSKNSPSYLASAFLKNYERAGVEVEEKRRSNAEAWYKYLNGKDYEGGSGTIPYISRKKKAFKFYLFKRKDLIK